MVAAPHAQDSIHVGAETTVRNHGNERISVCTAIGFTRDWAGLVDAPPAVELGSVQVRGRVVLFGALVRERGGVIDLEDIAVAVSAERGFKQEGTGARVPHNGKLLLVAAHVELAEVAQVVVVCHGGLVGRSKRLKELFERVKVAGLRRVTILANRAS